MYQYPIICSNFPERLQRDMHVNRYEYSIGPLSSRYNSHTHQDEYVVVSFKSLWTTTSTVIWKKGMPGYINSE